MKMVIDSCYFVVIGSGVYECLCVCVSFLLIFLVYDYYWRLVIFMGVVTVIRLEGFFSTTFCRVGFADR